MVRSLEAQLDAMTSSMTSQLEHLSSVCDTLVHSAKSSVSSQPKYHAQSVDRTANVVITGVPEDSDRNVWRDKMLCYKLCVANYE